MTLYKVLINRNGFGSFKTASCFSQTTTTKTYLHHRRRRRGRILFFHHVLRVLLRPRCTAPRRGGCSAQRWRPRCRGRRAIPAPRRSIHVAKAASAALQRLRPHTVPMRASVPASAYELARSSMWRLQGLERTSTHLILAAHARTHIRTHAGRHTHAFKFVTSHLRCTHTCTVAGAHTCTHTYADMRTPRTRTRMQARRKHTHTQAHGRTFACVAIVFAVKCIFFSRIQVFSR
jgi:hypothetical protein